MWTIGFNSQSLTPVGFVIQEVPFKPPHLAFTLKRQDVRRYPVEEPSVVTDNDRAAGKAVYGLLQ